LIKLVDTRLLVLMTLCICSGLQRCARLRKWWRRMPELLHKPVFIW